MPRDRVRSAPTQRRRPLPAVEVLRSSRAPKYIRSANGPEFTAEAVRDWLERFEVGPLFIEPGSHWENGYVESFNGKLRDELLNLEVFDTPREAQVLIEGRGREYKRFRPHSSLGYRPPAPKAIEPLRRAVGATLLGLHREVLKL